MIDLPDPKAKELIDRASKDAPTKRLKKNIIKFLINFNIIGWAVSFMLAIQINNFIGELMKTILRKYKIENELLSRFVTLMLSLIFVFLFIEYVFYGYLYTVEISKERKIEEVLEDKEKQEIQDKMEDIQPYTSNNSLLKY